MDEVVALDALPAPALRCGADGRLSAINGHCAGMFRGDRDALVGTALSALFPDDDTVADRLTHTGSSPVRVHCRRRTGVPFTAEACASVAADGSLLVLLQEVAGDRLLSESQLQIDLAFEHMPLGMALFNTDGEYVRVNAALCRLLDRPAGQLLGRRDQELTHPDDRQADVDAAWRILDGEFDTWQTEKRFLRPDGSVVWVLASLTFLRDEAGRPVCWVGQFQDITGRKRSEHRLRHMAEHDDLTGVANRRRLVAELELRLEHAARHDECGAVLVLDLDGFKAINDTRGHEAGDQLLVTAAVALRRRLRVTDVLARLGGDEFAVVLPHVDGGNALRVAEQLLAEIRASTHGAVTASCGIALYGPDRPGSPDALLAAADRAMYVAKARGRDGAVLATA